jgi:hypothetical protein
MMPRGRQGPTATPCHGLVGGAAEKSNPWAVLHVEAGLLRWAMGCSADGGCAVAEQGNHQKRIEKTEAIARLRAAGREQVAHELENWRSENATDMGWDGWIRGAHPDVIDVIWT